MSPNHPFPAARDPTVAIDSNARGAKLCYVDVPCEIWMEIAELSEGIDVLSLSSVRKYIRIGPFIAPPRLTRTRTFQTCKIIHSSFSSRSFWIAFLHSMCRKYGVFPPTFSVDTMSTSQIKDAALRPTRWGERFPSTVTRWPYYRSHWGTPLPADHLRFGEIIALIPGGKFLITASCDRATVTLWDLGGPGSVGPSEIAAYTVDEPIFIGEFCRYAVCAASETSLRVLVVLHVAEGEWV